MSFPDELEQPCIPFKLVKELLEGAGCVCIQQAPIGSKVNAAGHPEPAEYLFLGPRDGELGMAIITSYHDYQDVPLSEALQACSDLRISQCPFEKFIKVKPH